MEGITFLDVRGRITALKQRPPDSDLEAFVRDFLTCSFLIKQGDEYRFSHRSIMEYLGARGLWRQADAGEFGAWARRPFTEGVVQFMLELRPQLREPSPDRIILLQRAVQSSRSRPQYDVVAGNAATLLARVRPSGLGGIQVNELTWTGADLGGADIRKVNLSGSFLKNCSVAGASLTRATLSSFRFLNLRVSFVVIAEAKNQGAGREALERVFRRLRFSGVITESESVFTPQDGYAVGRFVARVPDFDRLTWIQQRLAREKQVKWRILYRDELERFLLSCPSTLVSLVKKLFGGTDFD